MPGSVFANGRSILHKDDGGTHVAGVPDVCKTPSPGGPIPIPYPNMAMSSDLAEGTKKVKIQGAMAAHKSASISKSSGDEPGTIGGVVSNVNRGKMAFTLYSMDVKLEGENAVRFADMGPGNGNSYNDMYPSVIGGVNAVAYGDDSKNDICDKCDKPRPPHRMWATDDAVAACKKWMEKVESIAKDIVDARMAWAETVTAQLANAEFSGPTGASYKHTAVDTANKLKKIDWKTKVHSSEIGKLAAVTSKLLELHEGGLAAIAGVKRFKDASRFLPDASRMFGVALCKCRSKSGKQAQAFAAISGQGTSATVVTPAFDYAHFKATVTEVHAACAVVDAIVADPTYGRPSLPTIKDLVEQQSATALLDSYAQLATAARDAVTVTNHEAQTAPNNDAHYFRKWTLEDIAKEAIQELNAEKGRIYGWHLPKDANLGPPSVPGATTTSVPSVDGGATDSVVAWPGGKYTWSRERNNSNAPFACAAPKAVKLCQDEGHVPEALCEIVYLGPEGEPIAVSPRTANTEDIDNPVHYKETSRKVDHKEIAAHCNTCKELIPKMVCDKEGKDCP